MNWVSGRVIIRGSDVGVPNLLVTLFDVEPGISQRAGAPPAPNQEASWDCLGTTLTDSSGQFRHSFDWDAETKRHNPRPDLALVVSVPLDRCSPEQRDHATLATLLRRNAGSTETFIVLVDEARLARAGNLTTLRDGNLGELAEDRRRSLLRVARRKEERRQRLTDAVRQRRLVEQAAAPHFAKFMAALSNKGPHGADARYVTLGASVGEAAAAAIRAGIAQRVNRATMTGAILLSSEQAARFRDPNGEFRRDIPASELRPFLFPGALRPAPSLIKQIFPIFRLCRDEPKDPCEEILQGRLAPDEHGDGAEGSNGASPQPHQGRQRPPNIPPLIGNLVNHVNEPESPSIFSVPNRATLGDVESSMKGFVLHSGPADAPAFHDFHQLQIAFEHVWQDLFDADMEGKAKAVYEQIVGHGLDPGDYISWEGDQPPKVSTENKDADQAVQQDNIPPAINKWLKQKITKEEWNALSDSDQENLAQIASDIKDVTDKYDKQIKDVLAIPNINDDSDLKQKPIHYIKELKKKELADLYDQADHYIEAARAELDKPTPDNLMHMHENLDALAAMLEKPYRFTVYAANDKQFSVNFGLVVTYRQLWEPKSYQVGRLVKTVPLAPKEVRKFSRKVATRRSRAEKEVQNNLEKRDSEAKETSRIESEIVRKALNNTNFKMSAEGGVGIGIAHASGQSAFGQDAQTMSQETKKEFREAVFRAAEEYKSERTTEVSTSSAEEINAEDSGEISNPNDEIPVTYLFYELQRRYRVREQIHRLQPVILVAQPFPHPSAITEAWIVAHDWILRRVVLDVTFIPAMDYVVSRVVGDEVALEHLYIVQQQIKRTQDDIKEELVGIRERVGQRYAALQRSIEKRADAVEAEDGEGFLEGGVEGLFGGSDASPEAAKVREDADRDAYEREAKLEKEVQARLERETTALQVATEAYAKAKSEHLNRKNQIARLQVHIKSNIMYYMQAIWSHEPPDQRFFRLHEVQVPKLQGNMTYTIEDDPDQEAQPPEWQKPQKVTAKCDLDLGFEFETLAEVADLDNLLGFKGNYMMFPMRKSNPLTEFMTVPYFDTALGIHDPDGDWTVSDLIEYVCCMRKWWTPEQFERRLPGLRAAYERLVNQPGSDGDDLIVPTDSLYIEALPGAHPILEDFKLFHRVLDVKKVQAEVRAAELENLRMAARLLAGEREDPTIEKKVVIEGAPSAIVVPDEG